MVRRRRWVLTGLLLLTLGPVPLVGWLGERALRSLEERHDELARGETLAELGEALAEALQGLVDGVDEAASPLQRGELQVRLRGADPPEDPTDIAPEPVGEALGHPDALRARRLAAQGRIGDALEALGRMMRDADPEVSAVGHVRAAEVVLQAGKPERALELARRAELALAEGGARSWQRWARAIRQRFEGVDDDVMWPWLDEVCGRATDLEELVLLGELVVRTPESDPDRFFSHGAKFAERKAWPRWRRAILPHVWELPSTARPTLVPTADGWFLVRHPQFLSSFRVTGQEEWFDAWEGSDGSRARLREPQPGAGDTTAPPVELSTSPASAGWPVELGELEVEVSFAPAELFGAWNPRVLLFAALFAYAALGLLALRALLAQERQARRLATARGDLIAEVTHELRTPLTVLRMYAESLAGERVPPEAEREYLNTIQRESIRLGELVDRVAEAAREEEVSPTETRVLDPDGIVERVARDFEALARENGGSVIFATDSSAARIRGDEEELRRILELLLDNAVRYSSTPAWVEVSTRLEGERWVCNVRDHGPGIPEAERERLFERWKRGKGAPGRGAGMGLYLARRGAGTLGGVLTLETPEGDGLRARLEVPLCAETDGGEVSCPAS